MPIGRWALTASFVYLAICGSTAFACLNDTAVRIAEDEFRSRYDEVAPPDQPRPASINTLGVAALAIGSGLVAGAALGGFRRKDSGEK
jgi:hypothetical protein